MTRMKPSLILSIALLISTTPASAQTFVKTILDLDQPSTLAPGVVNQNLTILETLSEETFEDTCAGLESELVNKWTPTRWSSERSACFWSQRGLDSLRSARLSGASEQGTAAVELLSDIFWGLRVTVQSSVSASNSEDDSQEDEAKQNLQQLLASGGNLSIGAKYPWYAQRSGSRKVQSIFTSFVRVGGTLPVLGQEDQSTTVEGDDTNAHVELGLLEAQTQIESFRGNIKFIAFGRTGLIDGTKSFHASISNENKDVFAYGEIGVGFRLSDLIWLMGSWANYSSDSLPDDQFSITVGIGK